MPQVFLGLGSNMGHRRNNITQAVEELDHAGVRIVKLSEVIETKPVGGPKGQRDFLNAVCEAETGHTPQRLLTVIRHIEKELGRIRTVKDGPRTIDIDILLYDDIRIESDELTIPHPRMWERPFVTQPLNEIAPHIVPPQ